MNKQEIEKAIALLTRTYGKSKGAYIGFNPEERELLLVSITALQQQLTGGWIPVESRMPGHLEEVIGCDKYGNREKVVFFTNMDKWKIYPGFSVEIDVNAWQPLPEPWKEATNETT